MAKVDAASRVPVAPSFENTGFQRTQYRSLRKSAQAKQVDEESQKKTVAVPHSDLVSMEDVLDEAKTQDDKDLVFQTSRARACTRCWQHSSKYRRQCPKCERHVAPGCWPKSCWDGLKRLCVDCAAGIADPADASHMVACSELASNQKIKGLVQYSFATEDALVLNQCREVIRKTQIWDNCDLIEYGTRDEYWEECWESELKKADVAVVLDSDNYRKKIEDPRKRALKKEAKMILEQFERGKLALYVLDTEKPGGGPNDLVALLQSRRHKEMNARTWQRYVEKILEGIINS